MKNQINTFLYVILTAIATVTGNAICMDTRPTTPPTRRERRIPGAPRAQRVRRTAAIAEEHEAALSLLPAFTDAYYAHCRKEERKLYKEALRNDVKPCA